MLNTAYLSLGSNIEPEKNMVAAIKLLAEMSQLVAVSPVWETKPVGITNQPNLLNAAVIIKTDLDAEQLVENMLLERSFVAIPLAAIAPKFRHPQTGQTLQEIAENFEVAPDDMQLRPNISETVMAWEMSGEKVRAK